MRPTRTKLDYDHDNITYRIHLDVFFWAPARVMNAVSVFSVTFWHERGKKWIPISRWSLPMTGWSPPRFALCFPPRHRWKGFKLSESGTYGQHLESGNWKMCMYNRNEGKALEIPVAEVGHNVYIVTAAKCAKGYHFMQTYPPKCLKEIFEGYTFNGLNFRPNLFEFLLFNWKSIFVY